MDKHDGRFRRPSGHADARATTRDPRRAKAKGRGRGKDSQPYIPPPAALPKDVHQARKKIAVISDLHAGSKYWRPDELSNFVNTAYEEGVRIVLVPGDLLDGCYRHGIFEVSAASIDEQALQLLGALPMRPGLKYYFITGNHEHTFTAVSGLDVGSFLEDFARRFARHDLVYCGNRLAFLEIDGVKICMWHPAKGYSRAKVIRQVQSMPPDIKLMFIGHWHKWEWIPAVVPWGCHAFVMPSWQGGAMGTNSDFGNSLPEYSVPGGLVLSWNQTEDGQINQMDVSLRTITELPEVQPCVIL